MTAQLALDYPAHLYGGAPPRQHVETSIQAAESIAPTANRMRAEVLGEICRAGGLTIDEIAVRRRTTPNAISPRVRELVLLGDLVDSGKRRDTRAGRKAIVWVERERPA